MPTHGPGHLRTFDYIGFYRYFLTFCCHSKRRAFDNPRSAALVLSQIQRATMDTEFSVIAYRFMPDHLHLLVEAQAESSNGLKFIDRAKQLSGFYYRQTCGRGLWQRYSFEHVLRDDEDTRRGARYILENPIRGGLVKRVQDYPFVGSCIHTLDEILEDSSS
jgi:REP element-mobilizing transposase RayT